MASLEKDSKSNRFHIRFRFDGQAYKRSLKTGNLKEAAAILGRVEETILLIERGRIELPENVDPGSFILSDGKIISSNSKPEIRTLGQLFDSYEESIIEGVNAFQGAIAL